MTATLKLFETRAASFVGVEGAAVAMLGSDDVRRSTSNCQNNESGATGADSRLRRGDDKN